MKNETAETVITMDKKKMINVMNIELSGLVNSISSKGLEEFKSFFGTEKTDKQIMDVLDAMKERADFWKSVIQERQN